MNTIEFVKGSTADALSKGLRKARAKCLSLHIEGVEVTVRVELAHSLAQLLTDQLAVRALVRDGVATLYPRPYVEVSSVGIFLNGRLASDAFLSKYRQAWPELAAHLDSRLGRVVVGTNHVPLGAGK